MLTATDNWVLSCLFVTVKIVKSLDKLLDQRGSTPDSYSDV